MPTGWVASDATRHTLDDQLFSPTSLVSVAVAVDDRDSFVSDYRDTVERKCENYGIPLERPVIKDDQINKYVAEWEREDARRDIVESLLQIGTISNIHLTETTLGKQGNEVIPAYQAEPDKRRLVSPGELQNEIFPYYNLVSIWDYFNKVDNRFQHRNVIVDDFDGKESMLWRSIGNQSEEIYVVPKGDRVYPLLSLADLTMEYIKQEVDEWAEEEILDHLVEITPGDSAYVKAHSLDSREELQKIAPISTKTADTSLHYPHPVVFIDSGDDWHNKEIMSLDIYDMICEFVNQENGCLKFFSKRQDRDYLKQGDYIVYFSDDKDSQMFESFNDVKKAEVMSATDAMDMLSEYLKDESN